MLNIPFCRAIMVLGTITKIVDYDEEKDVYYVKSFSTDKYFVNRLRDNNYWFCIYKG
jgi:hypothetical protein